MEQHIITIYTRKHCHLCDSAKDMLVELKGKWGFTLEEIDISQSDELTERFGLTIPVICLNGEEIAFGKINKFDISNRLQEKRAVF